MAQTLDSMVDPCSPAEVYDARFVPALFRAWGPVLCDAAALRRGRRVLDVGCGTGALTVEAATRVTPGGRAIGLDANPQMLAVARRKYPSIEWCDGHAEELPFDNASFDAVLSQFAMMFFDDRVAALREMQRVLRPGGRIVVAVWDAVERSSGYAALTALLERLFGKPVADAFRAPFVLGDAARLRALCADAGLTDAVIEAHDGMVRFDSIEALVSSEHACAWTLGGLLDDAQFARLLHEAQSALRPFVDGRGHIVFSMPALLVTHTEPG